LKNERTDTECIAATLAGDTAAFGEPAPCFHGCRWHEKNYVPCSHHILERIMRRKTIQHNDEQPLPHTKLELAMRRYAEDSAFAPRFAERVQRCIQAASPSNSARAQSLLKECALELAWALRRAV
jgi:hypothetical protein